MVPLRKQVILKQSKSFKMYFLVDLVHEERSCFLELALLGCRSCFLALEISLWSCISSPSNSLQLSQKYQSLLHEAKQWWKDCCSFWHSCSWSWGNRGRVSKRIKAGDSLGKNWWVELAKIKLLVVFRLKKTRNCASWWIWSWFWKVGDDVHGNRKHSRRGVLPKNSWKCIILIQCRLNHMLRIFLIVSDKKL